VIEMAVWMRRWIGERVKVTLNNWPDDQHFEGVLIAAVDDKTYGGITVVKTDSNEHIICRGDRSVVLFEH